MTSHLNTKSSPRSSAPTTVAQANYAPSVPISIYRDLAAELQITRSKVDHLQAQNQQLVRQNQQLRLEIERVVQSALQLQQMAESQYVVGRGKLEGSQPLPDLVAEYLPPHPPIRQAAPRHLHPTVELVDPGTPGETFTEQPVESQPSRSASAESKGSALGNWLLALMILLIVVSAFGAGFVIVRPFLPSR